MIEEEGSICTHYTFNNCLSFIQSPELVRIVHLLYLENTPSQCNLATFSQDPLILICILATNTIIEILNEELPLGLVLLENSRPVVLKFEHVSGSLGGLIKTMDCGARDKYIVCN